MKAISFSRISQRRSKATGAERALAIEANRLLGGEQRHVSSRVPQHLLNRLRGGGAIGKAIVQHRPYTGIEQLLSKRVLSRAVYERIKDQVVVR